MVEDEDEDPARDAVFIEARRAIKPGEELTYNYGIVLAEAHTRAHEEAVGLPLRLGQMHRHDAAAQAQERLSRR